MTMLLIIAGLVLTGLAAGFLLAVSFGIRRTDRRHGHRSLRNDSEGGPLARSGAALAFVPPPDRGTDTAVRAPVRG